MSEKFDIPSMLETIKGLSVLELNDLVKAIEEEFGVSAAAAVMAAPAGGGGAAAEEKNSFTVILKEVGGTKMAVIKALKEITGAGLKEAKEIADSVPKEIKKDVPKEDAEKIKEELEKAGATVELQ